MFESQVAGEALAAGPGGFDRAPPGGMGRPSNTSRVIGGDLAYHSALGASQLLGGGLSPGDPADALTKLLARRSRQELYGLLAQVQAFARRDRQAARDLLVANPALCRALFQSQIILGYISNPRGDVAPKGIAPPGTMPGRGFPGGGRRPTTAARRRPRTAAAPRTRAAPRTAAGGGGGYGASSSYGAAPSGYGGYEAAGGRRARTARRSGPRTRRPRAPARRPGRWCPWRRRAPSAYGAGAAPSAYGGGNGYGAGGYEPAAAAPMDPRHRAYGGGAAPAAAPAPSLESTAGMTPEQQQALLQQVLSLTPAQLEQLPPEQKAQVLALQQQMAGR
ncbi:hypothetical protein QBZ16_003655 [Prototheca wickerhamii]|uniref:Cleavage stimulation factor subunit 2 hinge domain-containing protein n=1 Tax=Prototheca wickerhamii TaxID=3111 RepID=A0AAD9ILG9_PROWI|nr:hypothetical protein QBZ16_003655 [Prototheca wickerhamii]